MLSAGKRQVDLHLHKRLVYIVSTIGPFDLISSGSWRRWNDGLVGTVEICTGNKASSIPPASPVPLCALSVSRLIIVAILGAEESVVVV